LRRKKKEIRNKQKGKKANGRITFQKYRIGDFFYFEQKKKKKDFFSIAPSR